MAANSTTNQATKAGGAALVVLPAPRSINLHDLDALRREMARVYRDMRAGVIGTQDGARLVYVLGEIRKAFEAVDIERRIEALEASNDNP